MKRFINLMSLGLGLAIGSGLVYGFFASEAIRLLVVGLGAFLLAAVTIGSTALLVNRQWARLLEGHKTSHHHSYHLESRPSWGWDPLPRQQSSENLLPRPETLPVWNVTMQPQPEDDEVVA